MRRRAAHLALPVLLAAAPSAAPWQTDLDEAVALAGRDNRPILLYVGAPSCGPCRDVEHLLETLAIGSELDHLVRLRLDADAQPEAVLRLHVNTVPAIRLLTPAGRPVAGLAGPITAEDIRRLLAESAAAAGRLDDPALFGTGIPDERERARLLEMLCGDDALAREAALRRLLPLREFMAPAIVERFVEGPGALADRLACLDLLAAWDAPVGGLDPWQPSTITPAAEGALRSWAAAQAGSRHAAEVPSLPPDRVEAELRRLIAAPPGLESAVIRERLARLGPEVDALLKAMLAEATDHTRARLTALRYRRAASDELAVRWPDLLDRLASSEAATRRAALDDLADRATARDRDLLIELFSSSDPIVRESSLRLLRATGEEAGGEFLRLLDDPDANVRAAVLKQIAEAPSPSVVSAIAQYAERETHEDLVVHAVRVLREIPDGGSKEAVAGLFSHPSWRVRAEAVEAYGHIAGRSTSRSRAALAARVLLPLLDDSEGFVVSRVVPLLCRAGFVESIEPMLAALARHPEIGADMVQQISESPEMLAAAQPHLDRMMASGSAEVRRAIVRAAAASGIEQRRGLLAEGLHDPEPAVRAASATAILDGLLATRRSAAPPPGWMRELVEPLEVMLESAEEDRAVAALLLVALGRKDVAMPSLIATAESGDIQSAAKALAWLDRDERRAWFARLRALDEAGDAREQVLSALMSAPDETSVDIVWSELAAGSSVLTEEIFSFLLAAMFGEESHWAWRWPASRRAPLADALAPRIAGGSDGEALAALALYAHVGTSSETPLAVVHDLARSREVRVAAARTALVCAGNDGAAALASAWLDDPELRDVALAHLALGASALGPIVPGIEESSAMLVKRPGMAPQLEYDSQGRPKPIEPKSPAGLDASVLLTALESEKPRTAACAGYLLATLGDARGWPAVDSLYKNAPEDRHAVRLAYRTIAALDDDGLVPMLESIHAGLAGDDGEIQLLYWTIRSMTGPDATALRRSMRKQHGSKLILPERKWE